MSQAGCGHFLKYLADNKRVFSYYVYQDTCTGANVKPPVCRAFASWLRLTVDPFPAEAAQHLVQMVLEGLAAKDIFDAAVDAVSAVAPDANQRQALL